MYPSHFSGNTHGPQIPRELTHTGRPGLLVNGLENMGSCLWSIWSHASCVMGWDCAFLQMDRMLAEEYHRNYAGSVYLIYDDCCVSILTQLISAALQ
jgi:hypothetical protein